MKELIKGVDAVRVQGSLDTPVRGLCADSRQARPGDLFFALPGEHTDGHRFIPAALQKGVSAVVAERPGDWGECWIQTPDCLEAMARISASYYGCPAERLNLIAITGSNGKSTCTYLTESLLREAGRKAGMLTTIEYRCPGWSETARATTPLSIDLHRLFRRMEEAGATDVVMEVSSHGIALKRVRGVAFHTALFTNLSQDHLDFHKTMEAYGEAKKDLFRNYLKSDGTAVLNGGDAYVRAFAEEISRSRRTLLYGMDPECPVRAEEVKTGIDGTRFVLKTPGGAIRVESPLLGMHNAENLLASAAVGWAEGLTPEQIRLGLEAVRSVRGRLESVERGQNFKVLVDYAHTPDALKRVLTLLGQLPHRRIITVFGCGGERDCLKRPLMGQIVCEHSDVAIVTTDNARGEDPMAIIREIEGGMKGYESKYRVIPERRAAIVSAIEAAGESDIVLLAGKGHEVTQVWADRTVAFDDREVAQSALDRR